MPVVVPPDASTVRRVAVLLAGLLLVATGVALTITAEVGVAPYDVLTTGLRDLFGVPIGLAAVVVPTVFMGLGILLGGRFGVGSVLSVLLVGPTLGGVLALLPEVEALVPRVALFILGFVVLTIGITATVVPRIGPGPAELLMLAIHGRGHPLAPVRTAIEVTSVAIGWAMGGQVGVGTVVFALLIGPALRHTLEWSGFDTAAAAEASDVAAAGA